MLRAAPRAPGCALLFLLLQLPRLDSARVHVLGPPAPVVAQVGGAAELPCHLPGGLSAARAELRWSRDPGAAAVLLQRDGRAQDAQDAQDARFRGRVELVQDDLAQGRVALRIRAVRASDDGDYTCFFRQNDTYGEASVRLAVAALGSDPQVHIDAQESGESRLACTSGGWYPEPQVQWTTPQGEVLTPESESRTRDGEGLFTIAASVVVVTDASVRSVSCRVRNVLLGQEKDAGVSIPAPLFPRLTPWMVAAAVLLLILGVLTVGSAVFTWRLYKERSRRHRGGFSSAGKLLEQLKWKQAAMHAVDVTLDPDTAHPHLSVSEDLKSVRLEDSRRELPDTPERFDAWPCVLGREAFSAGPHCWEVEVGDRTDWALGVCLEAVAKKGFDPMTPENGFWAVELYGNGYWALTPLRTPLPLAGTPRRVGVFLDYDSGDVSFYSMTDGAHMYTFPKARFSGPLRPFFCLWACGPQPLTLCPVTAGLEGVTVVADVRDPSKEIPLSPLGEDVASGDADALHSKLISPQPSQAAP